jgi:hypothetical protein
VGQRSVTHRLSASAGGSRCRDEARDPIEIPFQAIAGGAFPEINFSDAAIPRA